jgi:hypothetical protein
MAHYVTTEMHAQMTIDAMRAAIALAPPNALPTTIPARKTATRPPANVTCLSPAVAKTFQTAIFQDCLNAGRSPALTGIAITRIHAGLMTSGAI